MDPLFSLAALALAAAVGLAVWGFRDQKADEHTIADYHKAAPVNAAPRSLRHYEALDRQDPADDEGTCWRCGAGVASSIPGALCDRCVWAADILPPTPPGMNAGSPLYAETLFDSWHPESPEATAARWLREFGEKARAKYADRDLTGAFPVVRAA